MPPVERARQPARKAAPARARRRSSQNDRREEKKEPRTSSAGISFLRVRQRREHLNAARTHAQQKFFLLVGSDDEVLAIAERAGLADRERTEIARQRNAAA